MNKAQELLAEMDEAKTPIKDKIDNFLMMGTKGEKDAIKVAQDYLDKKGINFSVDLNNIPKAKLMIGRFESGMIKDLKGSLK